MPSSGETVDRREWALRAFRRGEPLRLEDPRYLRWVEIFTFGLLEDDLGEAGDLTTEAVFGGRKRKGRAVVEAQEEGVLAGLAELQWFYGRSGLKTEPRKKDGDRIRAGDVILEVEGDLADLLRTERVGLNLLQRMSGISTKTWRLVEELHRASFRTLVVATRKTPWGPLDKRAVYLGGGGTHRLGLWEAILIKGNHLKALGGPSERALEEALEKAWSFRGKAAFIEVEVSSLEAALQAARVFQKLQALASNLQTPAILMLDNISPDEVREITSTLQVEGLYASVLLEASGGIDEGNFLAYAASGVDAISLGSLTHSVRA
ncbi:MAG: carboxylating nicotinate-nucleotide diphosphorylase, partial [Candidatus Methylomirabilales bacterium]